MSMGANYAVQADQQAKQIFAGQHGTDLMLPGTVKTGEVLAAGSVIARKTADGKLYGARLGNALDAVAGADIEVTLTTPGFFKAGDIVSIGSGITGKTIQSVGVDGSGRQVLTFAAQLGATANAGDKVTLTTPDGREIPIGILTEKIDAATADKPAVWMPHGVFRKSALDGYSVAAAAALPLILALD